MDLRLEQCCLSSEPSLRSRRVRFKDSVHVHRYLRQWTRNPKNLDDLVDVSVIWYNALDYKAMAARDVALCRSTIKKTVEDTMLGLETKSYRLGRRKRMKDAKYAVLMEQATQWDVHERNDEKILQVYEPISEEARNHALSRGIKLARVLENSHRVVQRDVKFSKWTESPTSTSEINFATFHPCMLDLEGPFMDDSSDGRWIAQGNKSGSGATPTANAGSMSTYRLPVIPIRR
jgi:hypothetical protein